jgi:YHS domain-containing protein
MKEKGEITRVMNLKKGEYIDPVCGMRVDKKNAAGKSKREGQKYYFCSTQCNKEFDNDPDRYAISIIPRAVALL